jgi:serine phosphatase RsbU (regulator of sigma subunit)
MAHRWPHSAHLLFAFGLAAFLIAGLSIADMFLPRPYDGVVLEADTPGRLIVRKVVAESGAARAGIRHGHQIVGIDRNVLRSSAHAAELLNRYRIGETVPYLVRGPLGLQEVEVDLGYRQIGSLPYLVACLLGFAFFFTGLFVLRQQPRIRPAQIFFVVCILFLLFLVCRLRPASYSWVDSFVLTTGMLALLFLPACFLHFFLIFPRPVPLRPEQDDAAYSRKRRRWLLTLITIYAIPPIVLLISLSRSHRQGSELLLISGAPAPNWWVLAIYMILGLTALGINARKLDNPLQRRGALLVLVGSLFGLLPFLITAVAFPSFLHTEKFLYYGVGPLILIPLTFAYAIVRFQLLDIRVILRKGLLYTATTAVITALYALGIVLFNAFFRGRPLADSPYFPIIFALAIVLLFEPLRRRIQVFVDRFYLAEKSRLQQAMQDMGQAFAAQLDLAAVVRDVVDELPQALGLHFAALYLIRDDSLERVAGPSNLPPFLPLLPALHQHLESHKGLVQLEDLEPLAARSPILAKLLDALKAAEVRVIGDLASPRRRVGLVLLSGKIGQLSLEKGELDLLDSLLNQAAIALETSLLLEERTEQAELERELEIAAAVQARLLPQALSFGPGWQVEAICRPARHVGGDFFTELPGPRGGSAVVYGDVAGKSVSGAMVMMAAHEALHSLAMTHRDPETLFTLANERLYDLSKKSFVALAYLTSTPDGNGLYYILAGQPQPLLRTSSGEVTELPLPEHRLPLGALKEGSYRLSHAPMSSGDLVLGYSDGVIEAVSPAGEIFGTERLAQVVREAPNGPSAVVQRVVSALEEFTQGSDPYDDVTLVAVGCDREVVT